VVSSKPVSFQQAPEDTVNVQIEQNLCACVRACVRGDIGITSDMTVWDGVVVTPSDKAYERKDTEDKEGGTAEERMDVQDK